MEKKTRMKKINLPNLVDLTWDELTTLHWEIAEDMYQQTKPIREEIWKRMQEEKKKEEELKKAS